MRMQELYKKTIVSAMKEKFGYKNIMSVPKLVSVTLNVGVGRFSKDKAYLDNVVSTITKISGQKPLMTKSKKSISAFKVREGQIVGVAVTLRGRRMYDFLEKLINITYPRVRDFRGVIDKCVDRTGNLSVGFREHLAFPEIQADDVEHVHGLQINVSTTAKTRAEGLELFKLLGFPFKRD